MSSVAVQHGAGYFVLRADCFAVLSAACYVLGLSSAVFSQADAYFRGWRLTEDGRILAFMTADNTLAETIRDLMQCVQAARDGVPGHSLFAMQCDLVLHRAAQCIPNVIVVRNRH
jgi:hypothetical protein